MTWYMLDTNIVSHCIKQEPNVIQHLLAVPMHQLCISVITEGELLFGLAKRPSATRLKRAVHEFLRRVEVLRMESFYRCVLWTYSRPIKRCRLQHCPTGFTDRSASPR